MPALSALFVLLLPPFLSIAPRQPPFVSWILLLILFSLDPDKFDREFQYLLLFSNRDLGVCLNVSGHIPTLMSAPCGYVATISSIISIQLVSCRVCVFIFYLFLLSPEQYSLIVSLGGLTIDIELSNAVESLSPCIVGRWNVRCSQLLRAAFVWLHICQCLSQISLNLCEACGRDDLWMS